ncbi:caspase family protein [Bradyrhizobium sp. AZCC 2289]|uniref:caspase family protein n=1 Tax=Bradyrhizobium sp. AZCC 2289 TaxID=3117026 RepID=UPI002FEEB529
MTVKRSLALERGENRIEVLAYNAKDLIASEPASVTVTWDGEKTATPPKLYVMAVGVNDYYDSRLRLSYAVPDATAIAEGFRKAGTGLYAAVDVTTVLDTDVTIANLDKVFTELGKKAQPRDVFVFFLAGHGKTKNGRYYFLPRDFRYEDEDSIEKTGMDQDKFQAWFAKIPARKSILLYDTCESGSLTGTKARGSDIDERLGALNRMTRATGRTFLTATTDDAPALEGYRGHGVFTYALLDALEQADVNKNGLIEVSELADYIDQKVPDFSFEAFKLRQIPQRNIVGNNFALTNKTTILTASNAALANAATGGGTSDLAIPTKPTHVVITTSPADVFESIVGDGAKGIAVHRLNFGTLVVVMKSANGWDLIAREGRALGYVAHASLAPVQ